jgi:hypothetical protein
MWDTAVESACPRVTVRVAVPKPAVTSMLSESISTSKDVIGHTEFHAFKLMVVAEEVTSDANAC